MTDAEAILRKSLHKIASDLGYRDPAFKVTQVSTEGANYTSFLYEATVSSKEKDDLSLFAKVAATGDSLRSIMPFNMFETEQLFYTKILLEYRELEVKHHLSEEHRLKVPTAYECSPTVYQETVIMENLTTKGYNLHDRFKPVEWDYAAKSFEDLAKFHALSIALKREKLDYFEELQERFRYKTEGKEDSMDAFMENSVRQAMAIVKEENRGRLAKYLSVLSREDYQKYAQPGDKPVIRHGDFRPSNLMNKTDEDGTTHIITIDFQTLICGSPVIDLLYFIFLGTDKQFRDQYYDRLLDHYYTQLSAAISRFGLDPEEVYSRENFDDELKQHTPVYPLVIALAILPLITVDCAEAPKVNQEMDITSLSKIKSSELFTTRFNEIIDELITWNIL